MVILNYDYHQPMSFRLVNPDADHVPYEQAELSPLQDLNIDYVAQACHTEDEVVDMCANADAMVTSWVQVRGKAIAVMPRCRVIARIGTGFDNVDVEAAGAAGIPVTNVPDFCTEEVANHAIMLLLNCARDFYRLDGIVRRGEWDWESLTDSPRISTQTLGLVGFGAIGRAVAVRAEALGFKIIFFDPFYSPVPNTPPAQACDSLEQLLEGSDYVSLHPPLTPQTRGLIGIEQFKHMKRSAVLVNTSRGGIVVEKDLVTAIEQGLIRGAGLDVFDPEPPPADHPLFTADNVVFSPHAASRSRDGKIEARRRGLEEVERALRGQPLLNVVNRKHLTDRT